MVVAANGETTEVFLLVRHACAGEKLPDPGLDVIRELDEEGCAIADRLAELIADTLQPSCLLSSPYRRCQQTLEPLSRALGQPVRNDQHFSPGWDFSSARDTFLAVPDRAVVCTHGEVVERVFGGEIACAKGAYWLVERRGETLIPTRYVDQARRGRDEETTDSEGAERMLDQEITQREGADMSKKTDRSGGGHAAKVAGLTSATLGAGSLVAAGTALVLSPTSRHEVARRVRHLSRGSADAMRRVAASSPGVDDLFGGNGATNGHASEKRTSKKGKWKNKKKGKNKG